MVELSRTIRFCLNDAVPDAPAMSAGSPGSATPGVDAAKSIPSRNAYSAWPAMRGLGRYYQLRVRCAGQPNEATGYLVNIKHIDEAVACSVLPYLQRLLGAAGSAATIPMGRLVRSMIQLLQEPLDDAVIGLCLDLTPCYGLMIESRNMNSVIIRQQFEFAAAHRLHASELSDQENRQVFGKCNNPSGHGHNYRLEVVVRAAIDSGGHVAIEAQDLDTLIDQAVIQKLDHQHLNEDVPQFANLNPTVENITMVIHGMIKDQVHRLGLELEEVSVWETDRTVCTYRGR